MKVPEYRRKDTGDFADFQDFLNAVAESASTGPPQIEELFESDNQQMERLTSLAQRKVTFQDNFNSDAVTLEMENLVPIRFTPDIKGQPQEATVMKVLDHFIPATWAWRPVDQAGQVEVVISWLVVPETPKDVIWRVWGA
jgi:hypothetical protein